MSKIRVMLCLSCVNDSKLIHVINLLPISWIRETQFVQLVL